MSRRNDVGPDRDGNSVAICLEDGSTIVGGPTRPVPNSAKSLTVMARRGFSDATQHSIISQVRTLDGLEKHWSDGKPALAIDEKALGPDHGGEMGREIASFRLDREDAPAEPLTSGGIAQRRPPHSLPNTVFGNGGLAVWRDD